MNIDTQGKSLVDLLDMLEPAPEPAPVSMIPQTWGWLVIAVILFAALALTTVLILKNRRANAYRRYALAELSAPNIPPAKVSEILRRTALVAYPRTQVAGIHGDKWLSFLAETSANKTINYEIGQSLIAAPYKDIPPNLALTQFARLWVKSHKPYRSM